MDRRSIMFCLQLALISVWSQPTEAQQGAAPESEVPDADLRWGLQLGYFASTQTNGAQIGTDVAVRWRFLQAGVLLQTGGKVLWDNASSAALAGGLVWLVSPEFRVSAQGVFGARYYTAVGQEFFDDDPGTSAALAYAGGLVGVAYVRPWKHGGHVFLELSVSFEEDLARVTRDYTDLNDSFLDPLFGTPEPTEVMRHRRIGGTRSAIMLTYGALLEL